DVVADDHIEQRPRWQRVQTPMHSQPGLKSKLARGRIHLKPFRVRYPLAEKAQHTPVAAAEIEHPVPRGQVRRKVGEVDGIPHVFGVSETSLYVLGAPSTRVASAHPIAHVPASESEATGLRKRSGA